jgi:hypothetical protein
MVDVFGHGNGEVVTPRSKNVLRSGRSGAWGFLKRTCPHLLWGPRLGESTDSIARATAIFCWAADLSSRIRSHVVIRST